MERTSAVRNVIESQRVQLGLDKAVHESATADVVNAIAHATGGNFRLAQRLFVEIDRVLTVNGLPPVTTETVTNCAARAPRTPVDLDFERLQHGAVIL